MPKLQITEKLNGYTFHWIDEKLTIEASQLRIHTSDGRITGELLIKSELTEDKPFYPSTSFNFTSERTRTSLIKSLSESYPQFKWSKLINQLCLGIVERVRLGEPVRELWTYEDVPAPEFLLEPILYKGQPTLIFGEKAATKSTLAIVIYTCLTLPWKDNPLGWVTPDRPIKTLFSDWEVDYQITQYNAKRFQQGMGLPDFPVYYRRCSLPLVDDIEQIQKHISAIGAEVIIIDSLGPAVGGDLIKPEQALKFTAALRQLKIASLIIGQTSKEETKTKSVFGSVFFEYYSRNIFELRKVQEEGEEKIDIALYHKYCNLGKRQPAMGFQINFNENHITIEKQAITAPELVAQMGTQARILALLKSGAFDTKDIMEALKISRGSADTSLKRLKDKKRIVKVGEKWGLLTQEVLDGI